MQGKKDKGIFCIGIEVSVLFLIFLLSRVPSNKKSNNCEQEYKKHVIRYVLTIDLILLFVFHQRYWWDNWIIIKQIQNLIHCDRTELLLIYIFAWIEMIIKFIERMIAIDEWRKKQLDFSTWINSLKCHK